MEERSWVVCNASGFDGWKRSINRLRMHRHHCHCQKLRHHQDCSISMYHYLQEAIWGVHILIICVSNFMYI